MPEVPVGNQLGNNFTDYSSLRVSILLLSDLKKTAQLSSDVWLDRRLLSVPGKEKIVRIFYEV